MPYSALEDFSNQTIICTSKCCSLHRTSYYLVISHYNRQTSNWIWFPLVQSELDAWVIRQNAHRIRKQQAKLLPSGGRPDRFYDNPHLHGGEPCLIPVDTETIDGLLGQCKEGMEKLRYVDEEFEELAKEAYDVVGSPHITLQTAWLVFRRMIDELLTGQNSE